MKNSIKGLSDAVKSLEGSLNNPNLSPAARATIEAWRNSAQTTIRAMRRTVRD
jgi:hypothetical protein